MTLGGDVVLLEDGNEPPGLVGVGAAEDAATGWGEWCCFDGGCV